MLKDRDELWGLKENIEAMNKDAGSNQKADLDLRIGMQKMSTCIILIVTGLSGWRGSKSSISCSRLV